MNRLVKLLEKSSSFAEFKAEAIKSSSWYLKPYAESGHKVTTPWIEEFWKFYKGE